MPSVYTLAIRQHNGWEALLAQRHVVDLRRTLHPENNVLHICHNPGEVVIPGGVKRVGESLGRTALRVFCEKTNRQLPHTATLEKFYQIRDQHFMLLRENENSWLTLSRDEELYNLNRHLTRYEEAVTVDRETGRLTSSLPWRYYQDIHHFFWWPLRDVLELFTDKKSLGEWQAEQYALVQQVGRFYDNYPLVLVGQNRRDFSKTFEQALSKLVNDHPVTSIQVYPEYDRDRSTLLMFGRAGRITHAHDGVEQLKGDHFEFFSERPLVGAVYVVWAYNGKDRVLEGETMSYAGTDDFGSHTFVKTYGGGDEENAEENAEAGRSLKRSAHESASRQGGWTPVPVEFEVQKPYNLELDSRYVELDGTYHLWVNKTDEPYTEEPPDGEMRPRTEQRFKPDYTSGKFEYEAEMMVPSGSSGMCVMQIHTQDGYSPDGRRCPTAFMLFWFDSHGGSLHHYAATRPLATNLTGRWFHLNVIHDLHTHAVTISVNGKSVAIPDEPCSVRSPSYYMKDGVYAQDDASHEMQVYIRDIKLRRHP
jgi:hypothetical protein